MENLERLYRIYLEMLEKLGPGSREVIECAQRWEDASWEQEFSVAMGLRQRLTWKSN